MNHPYAMKWYGAAGGLRGLSPVAPACPMLFVHGTRKYFDFHSRAWLAWLQARPGNAAVGLRAGHWLMLSQPDAFHAAVRAWLEGAGASPQVAGATPG